MSPEAMLWPHRTGFVALAVINLTIYCLSVGDALSPDTSSLACPEGGYLCRDGDCVNSVKRCDGVSDCRDGDDELGCELLRCEAPEFFRCEDDKCIAHSFVCDGENDCGRWEDEKNCHLVTLSPVQPNCTIDEFRCVDGTCIPDYMVCDTNIDCMDGSDEILGCSQRTNCPDGFLCKNKYCIPMEFHCDGDVDCNDGSDEENCVRGSVMVPMEECLTSNRFFPCTNKAFCIEIAEVCDNKPHCADGSDEGGVCSDKKQCDRANCSSQCFPTPTGPVCTCPRGYNLVNGTCTDVNECERFGICDQRCTNLEGSYKCFCDPGYKLQDDRRSCKVEGGEAMMIFGAGSSIRTYYLSSRVLFRIAKDQGQIAGIGFDGAHIYWTNVMKDEESIMRCDEDGSNAQTIVTAGLGLPEDLAVDWLTHNVYFTDSDLKFIGVCTSDGVSCTVLVNEEIDRPRSIALHPGSRYMYWSDWGEKPLIARSGMDGSNPEAIVDTDIAWPNGISIDYHNDRLYWVDAKRHKIESVMLDGSGRRVVLWEVLKHPYDIAVFEDTLYWSDWHGQQIQSCNKFTGKNHTTLIRERKTKVYGVHIFHSSMQHRNLSNPCDAAFCSHICLLSPNELGYTCACREDAILSADKHTCRVSRKTELIYIAAGRTLVRVEPRLLGKLHHSTITISAIHNMGPITYDSVQGKLIIYDKEQKHIYSYDPESARLDVVLANAIGHITDLDYDHLSGNIYWTDSEKETVEAMSLTTLERSVVVRELGGESPMALTLVPEEGAMFVAFYREMEVHIDRIGMDGVERFHIVESRMEGPHISMIYDRELHRVYWSDSGTRMIESVAVDGLDRHEARTLNEPVLNIASLERDLYWVDRHSGHIHWTNKYNSIARSKRMDVGLSDDVDYPQIVAVRGKNVESNHPCRDNNGNCSHVCLSLLRNAVCACPDGLVLRHDNRTCVTPITCAASQFKCKSDNTCILKHKRCNGKKDCSNGEDESNCGHSCSGDQFACKNGHCIDAKKKCDGISDCGDNSDELHCNTTCSVISEFTCKSGMCIHNIGRCNIAVDCDDGSDEEDCESMTCHLRSFRCHSGACIPRNWECDNEPDCSDGSDERDCPPAQCGSAQFSCQNYRCIDRHLRCDGVDDCGDNSDENDCDYSSTLLTHLMTVFNRQADCLAGEFRCDSGECLPQSVKCNGTAECLAGEDEFDCLGCHGHEFKCRNGNCIPSSWLCDQMDDCNDGSDEHIELCSAKAEAKQTAVDVACTTFRCPTGECLPWSKVCDLHEDCPDAQDEGGSCVNACLSKNPCSDRCVRTPHGPKCICHPGYELKGDGRNCADVNECLNGDPCAQLCENTEGSYVCGCVANFALRSDLVSCKAIGEPMEYVFSSGGQIRLASSSLRNVSVVASTVGRGVSGLDVNSHSRTVFWSTEETGEIISWSLRDQTVAFIKNLGVPGKLAVDWITDNVYLSDRSNRGMIYVCNVNAQKCARVIIGQDGSTVTAIAVDPLAGLLFWSIASIEEFGPVSGKILVSDLAGRNVRLVEDFQIGLVSGLALDVIKSHVYWADNHGAIEQADYSGQNRKFIRAEDVINPIDLTLFENVLHWLSGETGKMTRCKLYSLAECETTVLASNAQHLRVLQTTNQPSIPNPCNELKCSYLCVLSPVNPVCLCKNGSVVNASQECEFERSSTDGATFQVISAPDSETLGGTSASSVLGPLAAVTIILLIVVGIFLYSQGRPKKMTACPLSLGLGGKMGGAGGPASEGTGYHFDNKSFGMERCAGRSSKSVQPGQHEYENPQLRDELECGDAFHDFTEEDLDRSRLLP